MPLAELFLILYGLFALSAPVFIIALYVRYSKLRARVNAAEEETAKQMSGLRREVAELRREVAAQKPATTSANPAVETAPKRAASYEASTREVSRVALAPPVVAAPEPAQPVAPKTQPPATPKPDVSVEPKPEPPPPKPLPETKRQPTAPPPEPTPTVAATPPTAPSSVPTPVPVTTPAGPARPAAVPPAASARVSTPQTTPALRVPAGKATFEERAKQVSAFEETLGTNWLTKLGIVMLVIGVALLGIFELRAMGPAGKVILSYSTAIVLLVGGMVVEKRANYQILGRAGIGGGWALLFFSTFGIHHVGAMKVLSSLTLDCVLMLAVAVAMAADTLRYRSQFVTGLAFLLGYTTVALSEDTVYSLLAGVMLAIGLVGIVLRMGWFELEVFGILSTYLNHLYWLYRLLGVDGAHGRAFPQFEASTVILAIYWLTFRISYLARRIQSDKEEHVSTAAALLNAGLLLGVLKFQSVEPELAYLALLIIGLLEFACGQLPITKKRREAFVVLTVLGAALILAAVPSHYSGNNVAILWLVGTEVFLISGVLVNEVVFRRIGLLTGLLVGAHLVAVDFRELVRLRFTSETRMPGAAILFGLCAIVLYANALGIGRRWRAFFVDWPDRPLLTTHSYVAAFSAAAGVWATFAQDWTALAFAVVMLTLAALARSFESGHLHVQCALIAALTVYRVAVINAHLKAPAGAHLGMRLLTLPLIGGAFYAAAKLVALGDEQARATFRGFFAAVGTALFALLIWFEAPELWQPVAFIALGFVLAEAGRALRYAPLAWHAHVVSAIAGITALSADAAGTKQWHTMPVHAFSGLSVVAGFYWLSIRSTTQGSRLFDAARGAYTWAAAGLMMWAIAELCRSPWIPVGWIAFAVALVLAARRWRYAQFAWQANSLAAGAALRTLIFNYELQQKIWPGLALRIITVSLVAAGLYFVARRASPNERWKQATAFLHSFAATALLAGLAYYEAPNGWLAPLWAGFALVLALIDRRWQLDELRWQAHLLSLLAFGRSIFVNLHVTATWHDLSVRLLSLAIVAVIFYAMARVARLPGEWRAKQMQHAYSWAASTMASLMLWYELKPLGIAVGWAAFGLVLFEYGLLRKIAQFRYQAYVAFVASFVRIFFANLMAGEPGVFWNARTYTILPLAVIFFFVYAQLSEVDAAEGGAGEPARDRRAPVEALLATLGTASMAALFYFQFRSEWVVTAWAAMACALLAVALLANRSVFLYQGMAMTLVTFGRGAAHNLFGASYFSGNDWTGRYMVLGSAVAFLLVSLAFAFPLRERVSFPWSGGSIERAVSAMVRRPEQVQFFAGIGLLTLMLALKMRAGMVTVSWGIEGVLVILLALAVGERGFRLTGLGLLLLCVGKVIVRDAWDLQPRDRYITFIIVGLALLLVSYLYSRYRETIRQFL